MLYLLEAMLYVEYVLPVNDKEHHHVPFDELLAIVDDTIAFSLMLIYMVVPEFYINELQSHPCDFIQTKSLPRRTLRYQMTTLCCKVLEIIPISCQWITIKSIKLKRSLQIFSMSSITSMSNEVECISIDS